MGGNKMTGFAKYWLDWSSQTVRPAFYRTASISTVSRVWSGRRV